jgi:hypothetical protein
MLYSMSTCLLQAERKLSSRLLQAERTQQQLQMQKLHYDSTDLLVTSNVSGANVAYNEANASISSRAYTRATVFYSYAVLRVMVLTLGCFQVHIWGWLELWWCEVTLTAVHLC